MSETISGYQNTLQILNPGSPSVTITGTIKAGASLDATPYNLAHSYGAVYGPEGINFTVTNLGLIDDTNPTITNYGNAGIVLGGIGTVTNAGIILSTIGEGVYLYSGGSIANSGTIIGGIQAIFIGGGQGVGSGNGARPVTTASVVNTGYLAATAGSNSSAITVFDGGTIDNAAAGTVVAENGIGIDLAAGNFDIATPTLTAGAIVNAGKVDAAYGVYLDALGALTNSGTVSASRYAVEVAAGNVVNSGTLAGDKLGILAFAATSISNSGTIESTDTAIFTVANTFHGALTLSPAGIELLEGGTVSNSSGGLITGEIGVDVGGSGATAITNAGNISGAGAGVLAIGVASVTNSGSISATGTTFVVQGETLGSSGVALLDGGNVANLAGGSIIALEVGVAGTSSLGIATTLDNSGLIEVTGTTNEKAGTITFPPIAADLAAGGAVSNSSLGTITSSGVGIVLADPSLTGSSVLNSGLIAGGNTTFVNGLNTYSSNGILLLDGGPVTNTVHGTITGTEAGIAFDPNTLNAAGTVINAGLITSTGGVFASDGFTIQSTALVLDSGGAVTNQSTGTISGLDGALIYGGTAGIPSFIDNFGTITGTGNFGVVLQTNTNLDNAGVITGGIAGAFLYYGTQLTNGGAITGIQNGILALNSLGLAATIDNTGVISGGDQTYVSGTLTDDDTGASLVEGGIFDNAATGTVSAYLGFFGGAGTTLINAGTINGLSAPAVYLAGNGDRVVADPGAVFNGLVADGNENGVLELAAGSAAGTFDSQLLGFNTLAVDAGAAWVVAGTYAFPTLINDGAILVNAGDALTISDAVTGTGTIVLDPSTVTLNGSVDAGQQVSFAGAGDTLNLGDPLEFAGTIAGFTAGDVINLTSLALADIVGESFANGILTLAESAGSITLDFAGSAIPNGASFNVTGSAATELTLSQNAECFLAGTRIMTPHGAVAVERLAAGDTVLTFAGWTAPVQWIGRRSYDARFAAQNHLARPVCIHTDAIAAGIPERDLFVSPGHGIFIDDVLVPAWRLINGKTITQPEFVGEIRYYHIELASHEVIRAENCPAETYLDIGGRTQFQNATDWPGCVVAGTPLPRIESGIALEAIKARLNARAGVATRVENAASGVIGKVDHIGPNLVTGWALCPEAPEAPVGLDVYFWLGGTLNRKIILANAYNPQLRIAGLCSGCHGFAVELPDGASGVRVLRTADRTDLAFIEPDRITAAA